MIIVIFNSVARKSTSSSSTLRKHSGHNKEGLITKIIRIVKMALYALILAIAQMLVLMMFNSFVMFKFLLVAMWGLGLFALKIWLSQKHEGTVIVHEDVHHDHHYEDDHHFDHVQVEDWNRHYLPKEDYAHKIAYAGQKPSSSSSWTSWLND